MLIKNIRFLLIIVMLVSSNLNAEVIEVDFRDVYPFGGGLHCSTTDVYREGKCEDYFPKQ